MRKVALGITATVALLGAAVLLVVVTGWVPRGPMNHGWDWPWHDWWHSRLERSLLHHHGPTMTQMLVRMPLERNVTEALPQNSHQMAYGRLRDVQFLGASGAVERWQSATHLMVKP